MSLKNLGPLGPRGRRFLKESRARILRRLGLLKGDWQKALPAELQFWQFALKDHGRDWWPGEFSERMNPDLPLQDYLRELIGAPAGATVRILDVGAGPLTRVGRQWSGRTVQIVPVDPLAREYDELLTRLSIQPPVRTIYAQAEKLLDLFEREAFDLAYASNALDHSISPLLSIEQMLAVVKPACYVYLWHFANEGLVEGYAGLHQWNFCAKHGDLVISDGRKTYSAAAEFKSLADVTCENEQAYGKTVVVAKVRKKAVG
ncbi:MAG: hypothetical protein HYY24_23170 [Verrucomicrobia bacterium]|nr:hypothetical protein [Verrucomicrobiota bacterium]